MSDFVILNESRLLSRVQRATHRYGCDIDEYLTDHPQKPVMPTLPSLKAVETSFLNASYLATTFHPWLRICLSTLNAYASAFRGPQRSDQMMETLRNASQTSNCTKLASLMGRCCEMSGSFVDKVNEIKKLSRWSDQSVHEENLAALLEWCGCPKDEPSMQDAWSDFLDRLYLTTPTLVEAHNLSLKAMIRKFTRQNSIMSSFIMSVNPNTVFLGRNHTNELQVISQPVPVGHEAGFMRLVCLVQYFFEHWTQVYGHETLYSQTAYGQFANKDANDHDHRRERFDGRPKGRKKFRV